MSSPTIDVSIIIVSYNTRDMLLKCLRSVFAQTTRVTFEVIVIDNDSQDGSADAVEREFGDRVRLMRKATNLGFARANNVAGEEARGRYVLLLNPDTEIYDGAIDTLVSFAQSRPEGGIWGGRTVFPDGSLNIASCWNRATPWSVFCKAVGLNVLFRRSELFNSEGIGDWRRDSVREVDIVVGCFLLITASLWRELGGFDERYWMYGEEADLCYRAQELGYRPMITPEATIMHVVGASFAIRPEKSVLVAQARATLIRQCWRPWWRPVGLACLWVWALNRVLAWRVMSVLTCGRKPKNAAIWIRVWRERRNWIKGYTGGAL